MSVIPMATPCRQYCSAGYSASLVAWQCIVPALQILGHYCNEQTKHVTNNSDGNFPTLSSKRTQVRFIAVHAPVHLP